MTKPSAAQRIVDYWRYESSESDLPSLMKALLREDRERRQMRRAINKAYEPGCDCATCQFARKLAQDRRE